jgi:hypothetical protein
MLMRATPVRFGLILIGASIVDGPSLSFFPRFFPVSLTY